MTALGADGAESLPVRLTVTADTETVGVDVTTMPAAPSNVRVSTYSHVTYSALAGEVVGRPGYWRVQWDQVDDPTVTGYEIEYRGSPDASWETFVTDVGIVTSYDYDTLLRWGHPDNPDSGALEPCRHDDCGHTAQRNFRVRAINAAGKSPWATPPSRQVSARPQPDPDHDRDIGPISKVARTRIDSPWTQTRGVWSDGTTVYVSLLHIYSAAEFLRDEQIRALDNPLDSATQTATALGAKSISLPDANDRPHGIWSNGDVMWALDYKNRKVHAYLLNDNDGDDDDEYGVALTAPDITLDGANNNPSGVASNGQTMWVTQTVWGWADAPRCSRTSSTPATGAHATPTKTSC